MPISALVAIDGSDASRHTSRYAVRLARALPLEISLVHAVRLDRIEYRMIPDFQVEMIAEGARRQAQGLLDREGEFFREHGVEVRETLHIGEPAKVICDVADGEGSDLVIVGRRGRGELHDLVFGSVCNHVMHNCNRPVVIVRQNVGSPPEGGEGAPVKVLVALDEGPASRRCLDYLGGLAPAAKEGLRLSLVYVVNRGQAGLLELPNNARYEAVDSIRSSGEAVLHDASQRLRADGYTVEVRIEEGSVGRTLCRVAEEERHELVLIGRRGASELGMHGFGAVSQYVSHHCGCHAWLSP